MVYFYITGVQYQSGIDPTRVEYIITLKFKAVDRFITAKGMSTIISVLRSVGTSMQYHGLLEIYYGSYVALRDFTLQYKV